MKREPPHVRRLIAWSRSLPEAADLLPEVYGTDSAVMTRDIEALLIDYEMLRGREAG